MLNRFKETTSLPKLISIIFIVQFFFFLLYSVNNKEDKSLIYFSIIIFIIGLFLAFIKVKIILNKESIEYKLYPFISKKILWNEINKVEVVKISALSDFLGWGVRYSKKYGWGYITNSEYAILIHKTNRKRVTLSIKEKDKLTDYLYKNNLNKFVINNI